ncbi:16S rRNA (uracil(1498)-N(3))-methyltransferase [Spirochaeta dissipatitropha]
MNRALFDPAELISDQVFLPSHDRRASHLLKILRVQPGESVEVGIINGLRGHAVVESIDSEGILLGSFYLEEEADSLYPVELILGHPRPIVLRRILKDAVTAGFCRISVLCTDLTEKSYMKSSFWSEPKDLRELLILGAEQAGGTVLPQLERHWSVKQYLKNITDSCSDSNPVNILLHPENDKAAGLRHIDIKQKSEQTQLLRIAVGPERGWSDSELSLFSEHGFRTAHFGSRILRTESAVQWAIAQLVSLYSVH